MQKQFCLEKCLIVYKTGLPTMMKVSENFL